MAPMPLYRRIQEDIKARIISGALREGDRIPSESELMEQYFVSSMTVKNALNGLADEGIVYRLKGKGSFVSSSPFVPKKDEARAARIKIGAIFPTLSTRIEQVYLIHLEKLCRQQDCLMMIACSRESPAQEITAIQSLIQEEVQGLCLFPTVAETSNAVLRQLVARPFPLVFFDRFLPDINASYVVSNNLEGGQLAARYLLGRHGPQACICHFPLINSAVTNRLEGFRGEMEKACGAFTASQQCQIEDRDILIASNASRVKRLLDSIRAHLLAHPDLRGLFAANVEIAQVAYYVLRQLGYTPGVDFTLLSFDNAHLPGVPYLQQDLENVTGHAMSILMDQIRGDYGLRQVVIPTRLVEVAATPATALEIRPLVTGFTY